MRNETSNSEITEQITFFRDCLYKAFDHLDIMSRARQKWPQTNYKTLLNRFAKARKRLGKEKIMSLGERQVVLSAIARGELETETEDMKSGSANREGEPAVRREKASISARMAAICELNKIDGVYTQEGAKPRNVIVRATKKRPEKAVLNNGQEAITGGQNNNGEQH